MILETRDHDLKEKGDIGRGIMITPPLDEDYWYWRVQLGDNGQAILGFPKFTTIGIGFAQEQEDWNTNLPFPCSARKIFEHIKPNKGDEAISDTDCIEAIELVREAARNFKALSADEWLEQQERVQKE